MRMERRGTMTGVCACATPEASVSLPVGGVTYASGRGAPAADRTRRPAARRRTAGRKRQPLAREQGKRILRRAAGALAVDAWARIARGGGPGHARGCDAHLHGAAVQFADRRYPTPAGYQYQRPGGSQCTGDRERLAGLAGDAPANLSAGSTTGPALSGELYFASGDLLLCLGYADPA